MLAYIGVIQYNTERYVIIDQNKNNKRTDSIMSDIFEKKPSAASGQKPRQDGASRRKTREDKERKEKRKVRTIAVCVLTVVALLFAGALFINSKLIRRTLPAVSVGGVDFSAVEFDYYFVTALNEYRQMWESYLGEEAAADYLPSNESPLSSQIFNYETGETWEDYVSQMALSNMTEMVKIYNDAKAAGYELNEETLQAIEDEIESLRSTAPLYGYNSISEFFLKVYGISVDEKTFRKIVEFSHYTSAYNNHVRESFTYSEGELAEYYAENADSLDTFKFRIFLHDAEYVDDIFDTDEEYEEADRASLAAASEQAAIIMAGIESEDDFIESARVYNEDAYAEDDSTLASTAGSNLAGEDYEEWLKDARRAYGDKTTIDSADGTYLLFFIGRENNDYQTASMRQILIYQDVIDPSMYEDGEDDPDYIEAVLEAETTATERANTVFDLFKEGGATESKFLELIDDGHSDDSTEGGFYEKIRKDQFGIEDLDTWLFDPDRKVGEYILINSEAYGYHLIYFSGLGVRACDVIAEDGLIQRDYKAWQDSLEQLEAVKHWAFTLTLKH